MNLKLNNQGGFEMATTTKTTTTTKKGTRTTGTKNSTSKTKTTKQNEEVVETTSMEMTPEMIAQFQAFMKMQMESTKVEKPKKKAKKTKITKSEIRKEYSGQLVSLSSCLHGIVSYRSAKTGMKYTWAQYGDVVDMDIEELLVMPDKFLKTPWIVLTEDNGELVNDFAIAFGLQEVYENIEVLDDLEENIEELDLTMLKEIVDSLGKNGKVLISDIAGQVQMAIDKGELDSASKINELSKILGKQLFLPNK